MKGGMWLILGGCSGVHGVAAAQLSEVRPVAAIQLERLLGIKRAWIIEDLNRSFAERRFRSDFQHNLLPFEGNFELVINYMLDTADAEMRQVDLVVLEDHHLPNTVEGGDEIISPSAFDRYFEGSCVVTSEHHKGHQAQAFCAFMFGSAVVATIDGRSWGRVKRLGATMSAGLPVGDGLDITPSFESIDSLISAYYEVSKRLLDRHYCEGKAMGLPPYGAGNAFGVAAETERGREVRCSSWLAA